MFKDLSLPRNYGSNPEVFCARRLEDENDPSTMLSNDVNMTLEPSGIKGFLLISS